MLVKNVLFATALLGPVAAMAEEADAPPLELLEYLGEWGDSEGQWLDPEMLQLVMLGDDQRANEEENDE